MLDIGASREVLGFARQAAIDSADASVAIVVAAGTIIAVNEGWISFGAANGRPTRAETSASHTRWTAIRA
ncbi:MAG: hypothetical protein ABIR11_07185 [Candidatus Limnocylindrales bacterium]